MKPRKPRNWVAVAAHFRGSAGPMRVKKKVEEEILDKNINWRRDLYEDYEPMGHIISLSFKARVGKDTTADYLVQNYGFIKVAFADSLKKACKEIFNLSDEQVYGNLKEVVDDYWKETPRYILQKVGTECMRNGYDQEIWIKSLGAKIEPGKDYVITDARFVNEVEAVKSWGGDVIRIDREIAHAKGGIANHSSEVSLCSYNKWDYIIDNNGTFEDLYKQIDNIMWHRSAKDK